MRKILLSILVAISASSPAFAHGHGGGYGGWVPFGAGIILGNIISQPRPVYVYPSPPPVYVYPQQPPVVYGAPTTAPVMPLPGQVCELKGEVINGQIVTGNFCYTR